MQTEQYAAIRGSLAEVFRYAAEARLWPGLFPECRWVHALAGDGQRHILDIVAHLEGVPVRWQAIQERFPDEGRITYHHVGGLTRGMTVEWQMKERNGWVLVRVVHDFDLNWPVVGRFIADRIVSPFFARRLCTEMLQGIKALVESAPVQGIAGDAWPVGVFAEPGTPPPEPIDQLAPCEIS